LLFSPVWPLRVPLQSLPCFNVPCLTSGFGLRASGASKFFLKPAAWSLEPALNRLLLGDGALARALARSRIGARSLTAHRQRPPMTHAAIAADFHQPLDVHRDFFAEVAF